MYYALVIHSAALRHPGTGCASGYHTGYQPKGYIPPATPLARGNLPEDGYAALSPVPAAAWSASRAPVPMMGAFVPVGFTLPLLTHA